MTVNAKEAPPKKLRILILEDEPTDLELIQREFKKEKFPHEARQVETKENFLMELENFNPDLILADYKLPTFDGLSALKILKKKHPELPFIFVSGAMGEEFAIETLKQGATDYVLKHKLSRLIPAVRRALNEAENQAKRKQAEEELKLSFERLSRVFEETVKVLVSALEKRDPYTAGHQLRVAQLATAIAVEMNPSREEIEGTHRAAILHDIGKINIPSDILTKPSRLTEPEYDLIKTHSRVGYDILKEIQFPWPIAEIVLQHHERIDGSGYPEGLKGKEILREAKIIGVADVVEAMASPRPYRSALGIDKALQEISDKRDVLYDPDVVDICLILFKKKGFKFTSEQG